MSKLPAATVLGLLPPCITPPTIAANRRGEGFIGAKFPQQDLQLNSY